MDVYSPLLDKPLSKVDYFKSVPKRFRFDVSYKTYVKHFNALQSNPGLRHRPSTSYQPIEEIELNEIGAEENVLFDTGAVSSYGAITTGTAVATAATATSSAATTGIGLGVLGGAAIVGGIVSSLSGGKEDEGKPIVSLPDHQFLGPGNTIDDKTPLDLDDEFARVHDILYEHAITQDDITKADEHFLQDTISDIIDNGNWHSLVSYIGIGLKSSLENIVGVQYPNGLPTIVSGKLWLLLLIKDLLLLNVENGRV